MCIAYGILTISKTKERWQSWSNASDLKSEDALRYPWVRIPLSPYSLFFDIKLKLNLYFFHYTSYIYIYIFSTALIRKKISG